MTQSKLSLFDVVMAGNDDDSHWSIFVFTREIYRCLADVWPGVELDRNDEKDWWGNAFRCADAIYMARIAVKSGLRVAAARSPRPSRAAPWRAATGQRSPCRRDCR